MAKQRYNDRQIGAILQRAGEIQAGLSPDGDSQGLTLEELQRVASEVGIAPQAVEQAALEVESGGTSETSKVLDHTVDGVITDEQWEDIVIRLRQYAGKAGTSTLQGSTREWVGDWEMGSMTLTASTRNGQTRFRLVGDNSGAGAFAWMIGLTTGLLAVILACSAVGKSGQGPLAVALTFLTLATLSFFLTRTWARTWRKKSQQNMAKVFADVIAKASSTPSLPEASVVAPEESVLRVSS